MHQTQTGRRRRVPWRLGAMGGAGVGISGALLHPLLEMAHEHNSLQDSGAIVANWLLLVVGWPTTVTTWLCGSQGFMFYHSHVRGSDFWVLLVEYAAVTALGWAIILLMLSPLIRLVGHPRAH